VLLFCLNFSDHGKRHLKVMWAFLSLVHSLCHFLELFTESCFAVFHQRRQRTKRWKMKNWIIVTKCVLLQQLLTTIKHCKLALTDKKDKKNYFSIFFPQHFPKNCCLFMQRHELIKYGKLMLTFQAVTLKN